MSDFVTNPEVVTSALGSWPSFHDAEILRLELSREEGVTAKLVIKTMPYSPAGKFPRSLLTLVFRDLDEVALNGFNEQNVLYDLAVDVEGETKRLKMSTSYGLEGSFNFGEAEVLEAKGLG